MAPNECYGKPGEDVREISQVEHSSQSLRKSLSELRAVLDVLSDRLNPVLGPPQPMPSSAPTGPELQDAAATFNVNRQIVDSCDSVHSHIAKINSLISRLQV